MMKKNWIRETISTNPEDKRKRLYELTDLGRNILENEILRIKHLVACSDRIIKGE
jgi:DNA-binding MarR family transcriptional regulator